MKIIATQGPGRYLIQIPSTTVGTPMCRILDVDQKRLFPPQSVLSATARGYWQDVTLSDEQTADLLQGIRHL